MKKCKWCKKKPDTGYDRGYKPTSDGLFCGDDHAQFYRNFRSGLDRMLMAEKIKPIKSEKELKKFENVKKCLLNVF